MITPELAKDLQKHYPHDEIEVRGFVTEAYDYFDAYEERSLVIAEANSKRDEYGNFLDTRLACRRVGEATVAYIREVTHMDISPKQIMSETTTLIPFVEHDDATRAEMGTNMMRQAVPLLHAEAPLVGTGMERVIGEGSGYVIRAEEDGSVIGVDGKHISVLYKNGKKATYPLRTFERSNHDMIVHQWSRVSTGDTFEKNSVLADGQSIDKGELAVGKNLRVAYMPW